MCNCNRADRKSAAQNIIERPSPNFNDRRGRINFVVEHYTAMNSAESAVEWLCNPKSQVSSHYVVGAGRSGLPPCRRRQARLARRRRLL